MTIFRALKHRNYRLFFAGQSISLIGTWMTRLATSWLVYRLSHSAILLGVVSFAGQIPTFLIAPLAGVYADRWNLHRLIIVTQILAMIQSLLLAFLTLTGIINIPEILVLSIFQGLINGFDMPARQSFMVQMIEDKADLGNAIALNSAIVNSARLIGPSVAGILIAVSNEGTCFLIDGISYLAVIVSLYAMRMIVRTQAKRHRHVLLDLREGFRYAFGFAPIRAILLLLALVSLVGMPYMVLMPFFADRLSGGGPRILGFLMGASGCGALVAGICLAARKSIRGLGKWIPFASCLFGVGLMTFAWSNWLWLSILFIFAAGFGMMFQMATSNTILQTIVEDDKRGRVMSFYTMSFTGMVPFGGLLAGFLAHLMGAPWTLILGGVICIAGGLLFLRELPEIRKLVRPIYIQKGIIQEVIRTPAPLSIPPED